ncbi:putative holin [Rhodoferax sp. BLA1]|uniref:putative holin n=1 Tax=Rhodoferax sp. BLA1 TaxID=2576062 RepID=UPI001C55167D|nr:putative holin [Rhodoferax sp. BLA1]
MFTSPRMVLCLVLGLAALVLCLVLQQVMPGSLLTITLYKAHLMALGGWGGYWLDRMLFPYDRPHKYREIEEIEDPTESDGLPGEYVTGFFQYGSFGQATLRRAIVVAACLICVALGA